MSKFNTFMWSVVIIFYATCMQKTNASLELDFHLGLTPGGSLPMQAGAYLKDSFRNTVLIPAFSEIREEFKNAKKENWEQDKIGIIFGILVGLTQIVQVFYILYLKHRVEKSDKARELAAP